MAFNVPLKPVCPWTVQSTVVNGSMLNCCSSNDEAVTVKISTVKTRTTRTKVNKRRTQTQRSAGDNLTSLPVTVAGANAIGDENKSDIIIKVRFAVPLF